MISLIPSFGGLAWTLVAFVVALSIIVFVHEYGHYIVGRWTGIKADVFSIGFGPVLAARTDRHGTRWQIAALPFGGYVKFRGDSDAASGRDAAAMGRLSAAERRETMHGAPVWARSATVAAGPVFNFILSILIFAGVVTAQGVATDLPTVGSVKPIPFAEQALQPGDRILALADQPTPTFEALAEVADLLPPSRTVPYVVERAGEEVRVDGPFPQPPLADFVQPKSAAMEAGLQAGDTILAVDGQPVYSFLQLRDLVGASDGRALALDVWRAGETFQITLLPRRADIPRPEGGFETRWLIGLSGGFVFEPETRTPGPVEALSLGATATWDTITRSLSGLAHMVSGAISTCNLSGPIGIAEVSGTAASLGLISFLMFIAALSTGVGLLNLFPVPILDGGHLVFHAYEAVTGSPPSDRALRVLMAAGLAIVGSLMVFAITNDLFCP